jgi:hypothetical protein
MNAMDPDAPQSTPPEDARQKDASAFAAMQRRLDGKPALIYGTLAAGALVLLLLLMIVWLSTRDDGSKVKLCLDASVAQAQQAIIDGGVRRIDVLIDDQQPLQGLTAIQLELADGECRKLPEGADNRPGLLQILGLVELYNQEADGNIHVEYQREAIPAELLMTSTPIPSEVPPTREASPSSGTPVPVPASRTPTATPEPSLTPTETPPPASPTASPSTTTSATP